MLLNPCPMSVKKFTAIEGSKLLVADASELGFKPGELPYAQLYDDAADVGITITNPLTGNSTHWVYVSDIMITDEIGGWKYIPIYKTLRRFPQLTGWQVHIQND